LQNPAELLTVKDRVLSPVLRIVALAALLWPENVMLPRTVLFVMLL